MDVEGFLRRIQADRRYRGQIVHVEKLPARPARFADPQPGLSSPVRQLLEASGIDRLYIHQVRALQAARLGQDWVVVTGTASGKTVCYHVPVLEACVEDGQACALYLYPTKALAQDQLRGLRHLLGCHREDLQPAVYDGDTPASARRKIRSDSRLVLTNPDMLHVSILPSHPKWARFFAGLRYVIVDEVHTYRGIFGAHVSGVLRRLQRVCAHYGSRPQFLMASATVANPAELASRLVGRNVWVIDEDGSPRGDKWFVFWNPRCGVDPRRTATDDAVWLLEELIEEGAQSLAFTRTRQAAELVYRYVREGLQRRGSRRADRIRAYRGGYLPEDRRQIEQALFSGALHAVCSTNALELGIDVGSLDAVLLVHYPGTIAATWQQAGRSGRRHSDSLAIFVAGFDAADQYLLRHPEYLLDGSPEHAVVDPQNPYVLAAHLHAAAHELPLESTECEQLFGPTSRELIDLLSQTGRVAQIAGKYYAAGGHHPAQQISLRHMSQDTFSIVLRPANGSHGHSHQVIANVDAISAPELIYPEAVYLHEGESYVVKHLDWAARIAYVDRQETDYYTQAILESNVRLLEQKQERRDTVGVHAGFGQVEVRWKTVAFKKIQFHTRQNVGFGSVELPDQSLTTTALWLWPIEPLRQELCHQGLRPSEALCGLRNLAITALPMIAMCDPVDVGGAVDSANFGQSALILYDRYPGGLGYTEKGFYCLAELLALCHRMVTECPCADGCPSCVGLPNLRPAIHSDPDLSRGYPVPNKEATRQLLDLIIGLRTSEEFTSSAAAL